MATYNLFFVLYEPHPLYLIIFQGQKDTKQVLWIKQ
jgi:hypothetical protein